MFVLFSNFVLYLSFNVIAINLAIYILIVDHLFITKGDFIVPIYI